MVEVHQYYLPPTPLIPNSPNPLLYYPGFLLSQPQADQQPGHQSSSPTTNYTGSDSIPSETESQSQSQPESNVISPLQAHSLFKEHKWETQWIFRYGPTQRAHYHSRVHECMAVLSGEATVRFGVADDDGNFDDGDDDRIDGDEGHTEDGDVAGDETTQSLTGQEVPRAQKKGAGSARKRRPKPLEIAARVGDVFVLPAGVAHKTFNPSPAPVDFKLLTPGDGHSIALPPKIEDASGTHAHGSSENKNESGKISENNNDNSSSSNVNYHPTREAKLDAVSAALAAVQLSGFTMLGAYPANRTGEWDFAVGGEDNGEQGGYERVWRVGKPEMDPVLGMGREGVCGLWA